MARPPRIEFPGAVYHVSSWSEAGNPAFADEADREVFLGLLAKTMQRFDAQVLAYCLLPDHYHLVLYTRQANLSRLMRHLGGVYTQYHNRHQRSDGALFHGRFKAILLDRDAHLLDVCRYVELNPLRLGLVARAEQWAWSSFRVHAGLDAAPAWLDAVGLWSYVIGREARSAAEQGRAAERYAKLVAKEPTLQLWPGRLRRQIFLGDEAFAEAMLERSRLPLQDAAPAAKGLQRREIKSAQQQFLAGFDLQDCLDSSESREQALYKAHTEAGQTMSSLAAQLGLSVSRISRLIAGHEKSLLGRAKG
ncbi:transposase [Roseateles oligotrophus]|uniref:Transposase n=1 Tax=Roseateles oligotrophus TaxID=1769250 RepID=A0ABT2YED5_9BURK|nr:transposase [Roseateles oligotrophus]MCV2368423.1 transposase [Roseateles oligotrophus]